MAKYSIKVYHQFHLVVAQKYFCTLYIKGQHTGMCEYIKLAYTKNYT